MPVLSPLIGLDKIEIEKIGKKIGTFDISILPSADCTAVPKYPETNTDLKKFLDVLEEIDFEERVDEVVSSIKTRE
jgi:thiamine biosynthesis protein ThiI